MAKKNYDDEDGVWRTIHGRKVFIKNGQSLEDAMSESGKFKSSSKQKGKADQYKKGEIPKKEEKEPKEKKEEEPKEKPTNDLESQVDELLGESHTKIPNDVLDSVDDIYDDYLADQKGDKFYAIQGDKILTFDTNASGSDKYWEEEFPISDYEDANKWLNGEIEYSDYLENKKGGQESQSTGISDDIKNEVRDVLKQDSWDEDLITDIDDYDNYEDYKMAVQGELETMVDEGNLDQDDADYLMQNLEDVGTGKNYKEPQEQAGETSGGSSEVTSDDLNEDVNFKIQGPNGETQYVSAFWSSNDIDEEDIPEGEDIDDWRGIAYNIYDENGEEIDGGMLITDQESFDANELCKDLVELNGYSRDIPVERMDNGYFEDTFEDYNSNDGGQESKQSPGEVPDKSYEIADKIQQDFANKDTITRDEFESYLSGDYDDEDADVRGILGYEGWETDYGTGDLTRLSDDETYGEDSDYSSLEDDWVDLVDDLKNGNISENEFRERATKDVNMDDISIEREIQRNNNEHPIENDRDVNDVFQQLNDEGSDFTFSEPQVEYDSIRTNVGVFMPGDEEDGGGYTERELVIPRDKYETRESLEQKLRDWQSEHSSPDSFYNDDNFQADNENYKYTQEEKVERDRIVNDYLGAVNQGNASKDDYFKMVEDAYKGNVSTDELRQRLDSVKANQTPNEKMNDAIRERVNKNKTPGQQMMDLIKENNMKTFGDEIAEQESKSNKGSQYTADEQDILDRYSEDYGYDKGDNLQNLKGQIDYMRNPNESINQTAQRLVEGGDFLIYNDDVKDWLKERNIKFNEDNFFDKYKETMANDIERLYNKASENKSNSSSNKEINNSIREKTGHKFPTTEEAVANLEKARQEQARQQKEWDDNVKKIQEQQKIAKNNNSTNDTMNKAIREKASKKSETKQSKNSNMSDREIKNLKSQKSLKALIDEGKAQDITRLDDKKTKALRDKHGRLNVVQVTKGTYGMNGALLQSEKTGEYFVITSRNGNLFYWV